MPLRPHLIWVTNHNRPFLISQLELPFPLLPSLPFLSFPFFLHFSSILFFESTVLKEITSCQLLETSCKPNPKMTSNQQPPPFSAPHLCFFLPIPHSQPHTASSLSDTSRHTCTRRPYTSALYLLPTLNSTFAFSPMSLSNLGLF